MDLEALIEQLLATRSSEERHAILKEVVTDPERCRAFFRALRDKVLLIRRNDPVLQEQLGMNTQQALSFTSDPACQAEGLWTRSLTEAFQALYDDATSSSRAAMEIFQELKDYESYGIVGANCVMHLVFADDFAEASKLAHEVEDVILPRQQSSVLARLHEHWAIAEIELGQSEQALEHLKQAADELQRDGEPAPRRIAALQGNFADAYLELERYTEAAESLERAAAFFSMDPAYRADQAIAASKLSTLYQKMGRLGDALRMADKSVTLHRELGSPMINYAWAVVQLASVLLALEQYELVLQQLRLIENVLPENKPDRAHTAIMGGLARMGLGRMSEAYAQLSGVVELFAHAYPQWAETAQMALARLYLEWGLREQEPQYFTEGMTLADRLYNAWRETRPMRAAEASLLMAQYMLVTDQQEQAGGWLKKAAGVAPSLPHLRLPYRFLLGRWAQLSGNWPAAQAHYETALAQLNTYRAELRLDALRASFTAHWAEVFRSLIEVCFLQKNWSDVWYHSESSRAYSLTIALTAEAMINAALPEGPKQHPDPQGEDRQRLIQQLYDTLARRYALCSRLYLQTDDTGRRRADSIAGEAELRNQIGDLDGVIGRLYERLCTPLVAGLDPHAPARISPAQEVSQHLESDTILLVYTRSGERVLAMGVDHTGLVMQEALKAPWRAVEAAATEFVDLEFQEWIDAWKSDDKGYTYVESRFATLLEQAQARLHELYRLLWEPLAEPLRAYRRVIVVPDDALHYVPFHALYSGTNYVLDSQTISYAPSASLYVLCQQRARVRQGQLGKDVLLLAYTGRQGDLYFVHDEVKRIQQVYPDATLLLDSEATPSNLRALAPTARIVHLATHGEMFGNDPFLSYLELAPETGVPLQPGSDDQFRVYDAAQLDLRRTDLVCLSACKTGQVVTRGGDLLGLQWGFLHAGAYALLANLWQVDDRSTSILEHIANGLMA